MVGFMPGLVLYWSDGVRAVNGDLFIIPNDDKIFSPPLRWIVALTPGSLAVSHRNADGVSFTDAVYTLGSNGEDFSLRPISKIKATGTTAALIKASANAYCDLGTDPDYPYDFSS